MEMEDAPAFWMCVYHTHYGFINITGYEGQGPGAEEC